MLKADQAPYFDTCPRCGVGGLERLKTHAFCVNCNYDEIYSDELCAIPLWVVDALKGTVKKCNPHPLHLEHEPIVPKEITSTRNDKEGSVE